MEEIKFYVSNGKVFTSKRACKEYEQGELTSLSLFNYLRAINFIEPLTDVILHINHSNGEHEKKNFEHWNDLLDYIVYLETIKALWGKKIIKLNRMNISANIDFNEEPYFIVELEISIHNDD
jgi:hypothetical protein